MTDLERLVVCAGIFYMCFILTHMSHQVALIARAVRRGFKNEEKNGGL